MVHSTTPGPRYGTRMKTYQPQIEKNARVETGIIQNTVQLLPDAVPLAQRLCPRAGCPTSLGSFLQYRCPSVLISPY